MWPAIGHLWFEIPKYISVVNKFTLYLFYILYLSSSAQQTGVLLWNKTLQPLTPSHWFCYFLYLHYSCTCSIKLLMLIWHTASIKIYEVQHNSAILKANHLKNQANVHTHMNLLVWNVNLSTTMDDQYPSLFPRLEMKKKEKKATYIALFCIEETYELNSCHQILVT